MYSQNTDAGPNPFVFNVAWATRQNPFYRQTVWTGCHLQLTMMCIPVCDDIGLEYHPDHDQFFKIESGCGIVMMGPQQNCLTYKQQVHEGDAIFVPAGTWHNVINTSCMPLKLFSIYAPPHHPPGTIHRTKQEAEETDY